MNKLKIVLITESEPFYMADAFRYLFSQDLDDFDFLSAFVIKYFRYGAKGINGVKSSDVFHAFGPVNFCRALWRIIKSKLNPSHNVKASILQQGIPVYNVINDINSPDVVNNIRRFHPDVIVSIGVNSLFDNDLRRAANIGCINIHSGIHPQHRGRAPIFWALADGYTETGVTVHEIDDGIDTGQIIVKKTYSISERSLDKVLYDLRILGMDALVEALTILNKTRKMALPKIITRQPKARRYPTVKDFITFQQRGNRLF